MSAYKIANDPLLYNRLVNKLKELGEDTETNITMLEDALKVAVNIMRLEPKDHNPVIRVLHFGMFASKYKISYEKLEKFIKKKNIQNGQFF